MASKNIVSRASLLMASIVAALVGFSYALATSSSADSGQAAGTRAANPRLPLQFTNPLVPNSTDRDLGDAALGSQITRYIRARGGFPPHRFTSDRTVVDDDGKPLFIGQTTLGEAIIQLPAEAHPGQSTTAVFLNGLLQGKIGDKSGTIVDGTPLRFDVTVVDSRGTNPNKLNETFRLTLVDPASAFKFAQTELSDAVEFRRYVDKLEVIGGDAPVKFSAGNIQLTKNNVTTPITKLQDFGLFLNKNTGKLVGRPLDSGRLSFDADAVDQKGNHALSRDKSHTGQTISFDIAENPRVRSEIFATKVTIKGDTQGGKKDSIQYQGILDLEGMTLADLQGLGVVLTIDDYVSPTVNLDANGNGTIAGSANQGSMTVKINPEGFIKVAIKNESFGQSQTIITNNELANDRKILNVTLSIGDATSTAKPLYENPELLKFNVKARSSKFELSYKFGPGNLGGGFIITSVAGKDDKAETGDSWLVKFISLPPNAKKLAQLGNVATATVGIGTDFTNTINCNLKGDVVKSTEKRSKNDPVVLKVGYNDKSGQGAVQTGVLPTTSNLPNTATDIPAALKAKGRKSPFPFLITFNDGSGKEIFGAEGSRRIKPKGTQWVSKDLAK